MTNEIKAMLELNPDLESDFEIAKFELGYTESEDYIDPYILKIMQEFFYAGFARGSTLTNLEPSISSIEIDALMMADNAMKSLKTFEPDHKQYIFEDIIKEYMNLRMIDKS